LHRLGAITIDQAVSSASNILITILAARVLGVRSFGLFGIAFLVYVTTQGASRALVGEPLLLRPEEARARPGEVLGTGLVLGACLGVFIGLAGAVTSVWNAEAGSALAVLALCTPLLVVQDLGRYLAFATQRPLRALTLDLVWLGLVIAAVGALIASDRDTLCWFLAAWAGSGALAGMFVFVQHRRNRTEPGLAWLRETWPFSWRYATSFASAQGAVLVASAALAGILGANALGAIRGALLLYGPVVQLQAASIAAGVSDVSHLHLAGAAAVPSAGARRHVARSTVLTTVAAMASMAVLVVLPDRIGTLVLGDTWEATQRLVYPVGAQMVLIGLISGVRSTLLGLRAVKKTLRIDIATSVILFIALVGGALVGGLVTALWSLAAGQGLVTVIWWTVYIDHNRSGDAAPDQPLIEPASPTEDVESAA
jgi:O-antigen/teichoic acid export membrane protein